MRNQQVMDTRYSFLFTLTCYLSIVNFAKLAASRLMPTLSKTTSTISSLSCILLSSTIPSPQVGCLIRDPARNWFWRMGAGRDGDGIVQVDALELLRKLPLRELRPVRDVPLNNAAGTSSKNRDGI